MGASSQRPAFHRRRLIVNWKFQREIVMILLLFSFFSSGAIYVSIRSIIHHLATPGSIGGLAKDAPVYALLQEACQQIDWIFGLSAAVLAIFSVFLALLVSHRAAGPMLRLGVAMKALARGEPVQPVRFRDADHFQEVAESFNEVLASRQGAPAPKGKG